MNLRTKAPVIAALTVAAVGIGIATAQSSSLGDYVNYGYITSASCNEYRCSVKLNTGSTNTISSDALIKYCDAYTVKTGSVVTESLLYRLVNSKAQVSVIGVNWNYSISAAANKNGAVTCK